MHRLSSLVSRLIVNKIHNLHNNEEHKSCKQSNLQWRKSDHGFRNERERGVSLSSELTKRNYSMDTVLGKEKSQYGHLFSTSSGVKKKVGGLGEVRSRWPRVSILIGSIQWKSSNISIMYQYLKAVIKEGVESEKMPRTSTNLTLIPQRHCSPDNGVWRQILTYIETHRNRLRK